MSETSQTSFNPLEETDINVPKKNFRINNKRFLLTYKSHLVKQEFVDFINGICGHLGINYLVIAHESGDVKNPYLHTHAVLLLNDTLNTAKTSYFDFNSIHPNIASIKTQVHLLNSIRYMGKEDPDNVSLRTLCKNGEKFEIVNGQINIVDKTSSVVNDGKKSYVDVEKIWEHESLSDALCEIVTEKRDIGLVPGLKSLYNSKPRKLKRPLVMDKRMPWQDVTDEILSSTPDDRTIYWFFSHLGNTGKSIYGKHKKRESPQDILLVTQFNGGANAANLVSNELDNGWTGHAVILNLSRVQEFHEIYAPIESIKDGVITNTKFMAKTCIFDSPHMICFANYPPHLVNKEGRVNLSLDRWCIYEILPDYTAKKHDTDLILKEQTEFKETKDLFGRVILE